MLREIQMVNMTAKLALSVVIEELENALESYAIHPSGKRLMNPRLRQELMAAVLRKLSVVYLIVNDLQDSSPRPKFPYHSLELRLQIEDCIYKEIQHLLQNDYVCN